MTIGTTSGLQENGQGFIRGVFDVERLMAAAAAQPVQREALLALMDKVCSVAARDLEAAWVAWREGQLSESAARIHSLRGTIGTLGATVFSDTSRVLEAAVKDGRATQPQFDQARQQLLASVDAALAWLARQPRAQGAGHAGIALDSSALQEWKTLLAERNIDAVAQYQQMKPALAKLGQTRAAAIDVAMARLDFAAVLHVLGEQP
ncbi:Hpt domain-containing protein [Pseudoduganella ginsengisoli]|nr:Hpt domain-containing protein [Pseudoduganella ginsengisoli]